MVHVAVNETNPPTLSREETKNDMKRLNVAIGEEEYQALKEFAKYYEVSIAEILGYYVQDLVQINSHGSDERDYARQYFQRTELSWMKDWD